MMNSKTIIALGLIALGVFSSCNETVDVAQERRATNEKAFHAFADSTDFQRITQPGIAGNGFIYMKVTKKGDEQVGIDYTDAITLFRDAYLTSDWIKDNLKSQRLRQTLDLNSIQQVCASPSSTSTPVLKPLSWCLGTSTSTTPRSPRRATLRSTTASA